LTMSNFQLVPQDRLVRFSYSSAIKKI
jgi:hypothetical protein